LCDTNEGQKKGNKRKKTKEPVQNALNGEGPGNSQGTPNCDASGKKNVRGRLVGEKNAASRKRNDTKRSSCEGVCVLDFKFYKKMLLGTASRDEGRQEHTSKQSLQAVKEVTRFGRYSARQKSWS